MEKKKDILDVWLTIEKDMVPQGFDSFEAALSDLTERLKDADWHTLIGIRKVQMTRKNFNECKEGYYFDDFDPHSYSGEAYECCCCDKNVDTTIKNTDTREKQTEGKCWLDE